MGHRTAASRRPCRVSARQPAACVSHRHVDRRGPGLAFCQSARRQPPCRSRCTRYPAAAPLITLLLPNFFGSPALPEDYWGYGNYSDTIYVGLVTLFLAWLALFARPRYWTGFLLATVLVVVWFAVGGPGTGWLASLPLLQQVAPHRAVFLLPLLLGWLAAITLDSPGLNRRRVLLGLGALLLLAH